MKVHECLIVVRKRRQDTCTELRFLVMDGIIVGATNKRGSLLWIGSPLEDVRKLMGVENDYFHLEWVNEWAISSLALDDASSKAAT